MLLSNVNFRVATEMQVVSKGYRFHFYRANGRDALIACRLSVRPSVTLVDCDHIGWNSSDIISPVH